MNHRHIHLAAGFLATSLLAHGSFVRAEPETAKTALERAQTALKEGRVHDACMAFHASDKLEPTVDTELRLASCYELDGKLMSSARLYKSLAERDANMDRRKTSAAKAADLEARAPRLRFAISQRPDGLMIWVDGEAVPSTGDVRVDVGPHEVKATAPGYEGHASTATDRERAIVDVVIRMEPKADAAPAPTPTPTPTPTPSPSPMASAAPTVTATATPAPLMMEGSESTDHRMRNGIAIGSVGAGLVIGAIVSYSVGSDKYSTEHTLCPSSTCANQADLTRANALLYNADGFRAAGTAMLIGGGAALAVGTYLVVTGMHHQEASHVALDVAPGHAGLTFGGAF